MVFDVGEKIHLASRRQYQGDLIRHFVGQIEKVGENVIRVKGFAFVFDPSVNQFIRRPEIRIRIISLTDATNIINVIPPNTVLQDLKYKLSQDKRLILTDEKLFKLDINEFGSNR